MAVQHSAEVGLSDVEVTRRLALGPAVLFQVEFSFIELHIHFSKCTEVNMQSEKYTPVNFATHLASLLKTRGLTQKKFAREIEASEASVVKWLNGSVPLGPKLNRIAEYFGLHPDYLMNPLRYDQAIKDAAREADEMQGTPEQKTAFFNERAKQKGKGLNDRQSGWDDAMRLHDGEDWQARAETAERTIAKLKKMLQQALSEL